MDFSEHYKYITDKVNNTDISKLSDAELKHLYYEVKNIQEEYNNLQLVVKRNGNSLYGVSASKYFSLHDTDIAEDITTTAKFFTIIVDVAINNFLVNWGEKELNILREFYPNLKRIRKFTEYKRDSANDVCPYGDTDSRYVDMGIIYSLLYDENDKPMVITEDDEEYINFSLFFVNKFLNPLIKETLDKECEYRNARKGYLKMSHETISKKSLFLTSKKYVLVSIWADGKTLVEPKIKYKGVEIKRGSMSEKAKKLIQRLLENFLIRGYSISKLRTDCIGLIKFIKSKKDIEYIYNISSVNGLHNIYQNENGVYVSDKTHIQMQVALSWLNYIRINKLEKELKQPFEGQKMYYYYCAENSGYKVFGVPDDVEFDSLKNMPEPDWNKMLLDYVLVKPLLRYIMEESDKKVDRLDIEMFLLGVKKLSNNEKSE